MMNIKQNLMRTLRFISFVLLSIIIMGSHNVVYATSGIVTTPDSYRPYYEWMNKPTAGVQRLQKIYVYANAGETVYFGSSTKTNISAADVKASLKTSFGYTVNGCESACMAITLPYDDKTGENTSATYSNTYGVNALDQIANSGYGDTNVYLIQRVPGNNSGVINDYQQEMAGPAQLNPAGYEAFSFVAPVSGVYTFRFFGSVISATNPKPAKENSAYLDSGATVAAFDVTVADALGEEKHGREFTDVLLQNVGANNVSIEETLYVLTRDGFEYKVKFNDFDPWGFVFFANKRGLLVSNSENGEDDGVHYRSLLRSVYSKNNDLSDVKNMGVFINAVPQSATDDESYYIFFERADSDVINWYTGQNTLAAGIKDSASNISNFSFKGFNAGDINTGIEGLGGYFSFNYAPTEENNASGVNPTSFEIVLDFSTCENIIKRYRYSPGVKNEVILSNTLEVGTNLIYWDGKDAFGNTVPMDNDSYDVVSLYAKAGEVHFPLIDVEGNAGGIVVQMLNEGIIDKHDDGYDVFYNNSKSAVYTYGKTIADNKDYSQQYVNSETGAMKYSSTLGNQTILDLWTNYRMQQSLWSGSIKVTNLEDTCIEAETVWQYFYQDESSKNHYDSSHNLPVVSNIEIQYRVVDSSIGDAAVVDVNATGWQKTDLDIWKKYEGNVLTKIYVKDGETYQEVEKEIQLSASTSKIYNPETGENTGPYGYIAIPNYQFTVNTTDSKDIYPYDYGGGRCLLYGLPTQVVEGGVAVNKYYQYRVVDKRVYHVDDDGVLQIYDHDQRFSNDRQYEIMKEDLSVLNKTFYQKESLLYEYEPEEFKLPIAQLWDDGGMPDGWVALHRPRAVQVAIMYGIQHGTLEEDIVWRKIQQTEYVTLFDDGTCFDASGRPYNLAVEGAADQPYSGFYPLWKYTATGEPYYYKIIPVGYSMNGVDFVNANFEEYVLPDFYALKSSHWICYDPLHDANEWGHLYGEQATITDYPAMATLNLIKTNETDQRIIGSSATYRMKDAKGLYLYFEKTIDEKYHYVGKVAEDQIGSISAYTTFISTSDKNSQFSITDLPLEFIEIQEIEAPDGYLVDPDPVNVHYMDFTDSNTQSNGYEVYTLTVSHSDKENVILPHTGGNGTDGFRSVGLFLTGIALLGTSYHKSKSKKGEIR